MVISKKIAHWYDRRINAMKYNVIAYNNVELNQTGWWAVGETKVVSQIAANTDLTTKDGLMSLAHMLKDEGASYTANIRKLSFTDVTSDIVEVRNKEDLKPICRLEKIKF